MFNVPMCCGDMLTMGTVLDFELLSQCSRGHVRCDVRVMGRCWILSCCLNVQHRGHVLSRCGVRVMGTVLDFELLSLCSTCGHVLPHHCANIGDNSSKSNTVPITRTPHLDSHGHTIEHRDNSSKSNTYP